VKLDRVHIGSRINQTANRFKLSVGTSVAKRCFSRFVSSLGISAMLKGKTEDGYFTLRGHVLQKGLRVGLASIRTQPGAERSFQ
jgi:hypothetical protein